MMMIMTSDKTLQAFQNKNKSQLCRYRWARVELSAFQKTQAIRYLDSIESSKDFNIEPKNCITYDRFLLLSESNNQPTHIAGIPSKSIRYFSLVVYLLRTH